MIFSELEVPGVVWGAFCLVLVLATVAGVGVSVPLALKLDPGAELHQRVQEAKLLLKETPLIDG